MAFEALPYNILFTDFVDRGSDNFTTRYLVNDTCVALGKTVVYGSILGFEGQLAILITKEAKFT
jgi:adenylyltransferase/sulfurtransferase